MCPQLTNRRPPLIASNADHPPCLTVILFSNPASLLGCSPNNDHRIDSNLQLVAAMNDCLDSNTILMKVLQAGDNPPACAY